MSDKRLESIDKRINELNLKRNVIEKENKEKEEQKRKHELIQKSSFMESLCITEKDGEVEKFKNETIRLYIKSKLYAKQTVFFKYLFTDCQENVLVSFFDQEFSALEKKINSIVDEKGRTKKQRLSGLKGLELKAMADVLKGIQDHLGDQTYTQKYANTKRLEMKYEERVKKLFEKAEGRL
ncbi:hypothetical protein BAQ48_07830 [Bacillus luti]|uniref:hypothetical protein n=1 Tax=Bacillus luti TaxID=2026191 RepID=UPI0008FE85C5|nr:hypothetical protein [Bacillus luti]OJE52736.1 hypothetical protein BAQ48_07830 [Bacillus luti]